MDGDPGGGVDRARARDDVTRDRAVSVVTDDAFDANARATPWIACSQRRWRR
jgi:hypothetical protein